MQRLISFCKELIRCVTQSTSSASGGMSKSSNKKVGHAGLIPSIIAPFINVINVCRRWNSDRWWHQKVCAEKTWKISRKSAATLSYFYSQEFSLFFFFHNFLLHTSFHPFTFTSSTPHPTISSNMHTLSITALNCSETDYVANIWDFLGNYNFSSASSFAFAVRSTSQHFPSTCWFLFRQAEDLRSQWVNSFVAFYVFSYPPTMLSWSSVIDNLFYEITWG